MKTARQFYMECETPEAIIEAFKKFAKMHTEAALKVASEKAEMAARQYLRVSDDEDYNKNHVLYCYPLENIV